MERDEKDVIADIDAYIEQSERENKKSCKLQIRLRPAQRAELERRAEQQQMTMSQYIIWKCLTD